MVTIEEIARDLITTSGPVTATQVWDAAKADGRRVSHATVEKVLTAQRRAGHLRYDAAGGFTYSLPAGLAVGTRVRHRRWTYLEGTVTAVEPGPRGPGYVIQWDQSGEAYDRLGWPGMRGHDTTVEAITTTMEAVR